MDERPPPHYPPPQCRKAHGEYSPACMLRSIMALRTSPCPATAACLAPYMALVNVYRIACCRPRSCFPEAIA